MNNQLASKMTEALRLTLAGRLGEATAAHLARQLAGEPDHPGAGQRRQKTDRQERFAERVPRQPSDEHRHRRMINVSPGQVLGAGQVIHLVAKDAVTSGSQKMQQQLAGSDVQHDRRAGGEA